MKKISLSKETLRVLTTQEIAGVAGGALITRRDDCVTETRPVNVCNPSAACPSAACPVNTSACPTTTTNGCPQLSDRCPPQTQICPESRFCPV